MALIVAKCKDCKYIGYSFSEEQVIRKAEEHMMQTGHIVTTTDNN